MRAKLRAWLPPLAAVAMAAVVTLPHGAAGDDRRDCRRSQDCALDALQSGQTRPLSEVLAVARDKLAGEVIKIELDREDGIWVYEITILSPSGRRQKIEINARTLAVLKTK